MDGEGAERPARSTLGGDRRGGSVRGGRKEGGVIATSRPHIYALARPVGGGYTHSLMQGEARTKDRHTEHGRRLQEKRMKRIR